MRELYRLRRQIESTDELLSVVRTMKTMAAVNIRQYEAAVASVRTYMETVELGFQVALANDRELIHTGAVAADRPVGAIVFGSDQGMCGAFNERAADYATATLRGRGVGAEDCSLVLVGHRMGFQFDGSDYDIHGHFELPSSVEGVSGFVRRLISHVGEWRDTRGLERVWLVYNLAGEGARYTPHLRELLPIDRRFLEEIAGREWDSRTEPMAAGEPGELFRALVDEYLYVGLFRACAESLASENGARLMAMQRAQQNISERLDGLRANHRRTRQSSITAELLDIVGGYTALSED